jgi:cyclopropane fatty-acyl-phospholipid synthase-like methyltransferase
MVYSKFTSHEYGTPISTLPPQIDSKGKMNFSTTGLLLTLVLNPILTFNLLQYLSSYLSTYSPFFTYFSSLTWWFLIPITVLTILPSFAIYMYVSSLWFNPFNKGDPHKYWIFNDESLSKKYRGRCIPIETLHELYFQGKMEPKEDLLSTLHHRHEYACFTIGWRHIKFFVCQWIPELLVHSKKQDEDQVRDHYDRGDDFYNSFLHDIMVYTSGIVSNDDDSEDIAKIQERKLDLICDKILLEKGDRLLDIGCGWGTLSVHAAKRGAKATGVTLSKNQIVWGMNRAKEAKVEDNVEIKCIDYRDIPESKFDKITCVEMAEHVGVRLFGNFMDQVYSLLEDDGVFFLQIAGLRQPWQFEDLLWGLFMAKYVFPGADASCPLWWVVNKLEDHGFEVQSVDNIGIHYSHTIKLWYNHWKSNENKMTDKYSQKWYRIWMWFLSYSSIIASQGSATCYQIVSHKNLNKFNRKRFLNRNL